MAPARPRCCPRILPRLRCSASDALRSQTQAHAPSLAAPSTDKLLTCSQDIITGDEIISDSYNLKEIDGVVYEADCSKITIGGETFGS